MNPYKPDTKEHVMIANFLEMSYNISTYIKECPDSDPEKFKEKILELIEMHNGHHEEIVKGE
jgi:hypothetical protein